MCEPFVLLHQARKASEEILQIYHQQPIQKALRLNTPEDFDQAVATLAAQLRANAQPLESEAIRSAIQTLDINWSTTTARERRRLLREARQAAGQLLSGLPQSLEVSFSSAAEDVVEGTRIAARQRLNISTTFNTMDERIIQHLRTSPSFYIRDEYGRRQVAFGERAQTIIADGLERGLGRQDIAELLYTAAQTTLAGRNTFYWEVVASNFVGQGRSFAQLSAYQEANIGQYIIEAILDERTTEVCRFLHGRRFSVEGGLRTFTQLEERQQGLQEVTPWVREAQTEDGKIMFVERNQQRRPIGEVLRSGVGTRDDRGEFGRTLTNQQLANLGLSFPPYHALCRTTTVADV